MQLNRHELIDIICDACNKTVDYHQGCIDGARELKRTLYARINEIEEMEKEENENKKNNS